MDELTTELLAAGDDDLLVTDEVDLMDDFELRQVVAAVERFLGTKRGIRVSVLDPKQWNAQVEATLHERALSQGAGQYLHVLPDSRDPFHLYVSPTAVRALNERSQEMYAIVVFAALRRFPCELSNLLRRGLDDLVAGWLAADMDISLFFGTYPEERDLVSGLARVLVREFGYDERTWALLLRSDPARFFYALRKSKFCLPWLRTVRADKKLTAALAAAPQKRKALTDMLQTDVLSIDDPLVRLTLDALTTYLDTGEDS